MSISLTTVIGNIGKDPEVKGLKNGGRVANFSVAVNEYRGKDTEAITHWYNVVAWGENAETVANLGKGDRVVVVGKFVTRKWEDKDGKDRYTTELVADTYNGVVAPAPIPAKDGAKRGGSKKSEVEDDFSDEVPF